MTSVSLEDAFWNRLKEIAVQREVTLSDLVAMINLDRQHSNLSSAIRLFVLDFYRCLAAPRLSVPPKPTGRKLDTSQA
jgi:predicted DNA-binding ribbon-helix-helix protein